MAFASDETTNGHKTRNKDRGRVRATRRTGIPKARTLWKWKLLERLPLAALPVESAARESKRQTDKRTNERTHARSLTHSLTRFNLSRGFIFNVNNGLCLGVGRGEDSVNVVVVVVVVVRRSFPNRENGGVMAKDTLSFDETRRKVPRHGTTPSTGSRDHRSGAALALGSLNKSITTERVIIRDRTKSSESFCGRFLSLSSPSGSVHPSAIDPRKNTPLFPLPALVDARSTLGTVQPHVPACATSRNTCRERVNYSQAAGGLE